MAPAFKMDDGTCVLDAALTRRLEAGECEIGWLARTGYLPLGYFRDADTLIYRLLDILFFTEYSLFAFAAIFFSSSLEGER